MLEAAGSPADAALSLVSVALAPTQLALNALTAEVAALNAGASVLPPQRSRTRRGRTQ